mmetsp:Transcript_44702/g.53723  ORF Transcript_44702/g.53723 Transcript_44702/m.53723 type:complete len:90 (-) Transcript_44702:209-478(-)
MEREGRGLGNQKHQKKPRPIKTFGSQIRPNSDFAMKRKIRDAKSLEGTYLNLKGEFGRKITFMVNKKEGTTKTNCAVLDTTTGFRMSGG